MPLKWISLSSSTKWKPMRDGSAPQNPSEPQLLAKLRCVETNPFSLPDLVSQGKILISGCLRRFIIVSSKPLRGWGERKPEDKHRLQKVWKIVLSAFSPLSLVQEVDCDVSVHESVVMWVSGHVESYGVKGVTDLQALILWRTGHLAFNTQPFPNVLLPRYLDSSKRSHPLYFVLTTKGWQDG